MVGEKAAGAVYAGHPRCDWLVDGDRSRTALVGWHVGVVRLAMSPLTLLALAMGHVVGRALALVKQFALSVKRRGASERLVIHAGGHCREAAAVSPKFPDASQVRTRRDRGPLRGLM